MNGNTKPIWKGRRRQRKRSGLPGRNAWMPTAKSWQKRMTAHAVLAEMIIRQSISRQSFNVFPDRDTVKYPIDTGDIPTLVPRIYSSSEVSGAMPSGRESTRTYTLTSAGSSSAVQTILPAVSPETTYLCSHSS